MPEILAQHEIPEPEKPIYKKPHKLLLWVISCSLILFSLLHTSNVFRLFDHIIKWRITSILGHKGVSKTRIESLTYRNGVLEIHNLTIPSLSADNATHERPMDLHISHLKTACHWQDLIGANFGTITIKDAKVYASVRSSGKITFGQIDQIIESETMDLKFQEIQLENSTIDVLTPLGNTAFQMMSKIHQNIQNRELNGSFQATGALEATGDIRYALIQSQNPPSTDQPPPQSEHILTITSDIKKLDFQPFGSLKQAVNLDLTINGFAHDFSIRGKLKTSTHEKPFLTVQGKLAPPSAHGKLQIQGQFHPIENVIDLSALMSLGDLPLKKFSGNLDVDGTLVWDGEWNLIQGPLTLKFDEVDTIYHQINIKGVKGQLLLDHVWPMTTRRPQILSAQHISLGKLVFTENQLTFLITTLGEFFPQAFETEIFKGKVEAYNFRPSGKTYQDGIGFDIVVQDIELNDMIQLAGADKLKANAKLHGKANLYLKNGEVFVDEAELSSTSKEGIIQYDFDRTDEQESKKLEGADLAFEVFRDLHFTLLDINLDSASDKPNDLKAQIKILGYNPKVLNAHPFEFNISASGDLKDLVKNTLKNLSEPRDVRDIERLIRSHKDLVEKDKKSNAKQSTAQ